MNVGTARAARVAPVGRDLDRIALTVPARTPVTSYRIIPPIISDNVGGSARHSTVLTGNPTVSDGPRLPCSNRSR